MFHYKATLDRVVDGDTVDLNVDLGFKLTKTVRIRLYGVDTPERGQPGWAEATRYVEAWFQSLKGRCEVHTEKTGKYGRWLGTVYAEIGTGIEGGIVETKTLNQALLDSGRAKVYGS